MRISAHRGASIEAPENTMAAFRRALMLGVEMIELDIRLTRDGVPVVIHDESLSRTTDGEGRVGELDLAELGRYSAGRWFDPRFGGERIPRLEEVFDLVRDRAVINVEIKANPGRSTQTARAALGVARDAGALGRSLFSCFDPEPLTALRREGGEIRLALLTGPSSLGTRSTSGRPPVGRAVLERMARARDLAAEAACLHVTLVSAPLVEELHERAWAVYVYTIDEESAAERLEAMGVDGVFTNDPARLLHRWPPEPPGEPS